ncbi:MAG: HAMP domain-containing sensor histidine kinase [Myxococcota bacterium]
MKQRLLRLVLLGPILSVALAGVLLMLSLRLARSTLREANVTTQLRAIDQDACNAAPSTWGWRSGDLAIFAYDGFGRSANPEAPLMERTLLRHARNTGHVAFQLDSNQLTWVASSGTGGPCAFFRASTRNAEFAFTSRFLTVLAGSILGGMLLAAAGTIGFVILPLRNRIDGLAAGARAVGSTSFSPQPAGPDGLGYISEVLTQSHDRIVQTRRALEQRNRALEEHLAGIAHDLRTPLSSMHLALESLAAGSEGEPQQEARRALADVVYLSSMVENLHQAARLRHELDVSSGRVELCDLVRRVERRFAIVGRHAGVEVASNTPETEVWVACNPALAERAVSNLVQNAVEHNADPGHVAIRLVLVEERRRFELSVIDDGPGLPTETLASLKNESFLLDEARPRGPGMGMLITSEVARRAGWTLVYEEVKPTGVQVRLTGKIQANADSASV